MADRLVIDAEGRDVQILNPGNHIFGPNGEELVPQTIAAAGLQKPCRRRVLACTHEMLQNALAEVAEGQRLKIAPLTGWRRVNLNGKPWAVSNRDIKPLNYYSPNNGSFVNGSVDEYLDNLNQKLARMGHSFGTVTIVPPQLATRISNGIKSGEAAMKELGVSLDSNRRWVQSTPGDSRAWAWDSTSGFQIDYYRYCREPVRLALELTI